MSVPLAGLHGFAPVGVCPCAHGGNFVRSIGFVACGASPSGRGVLATAPAARNPITPRRMTTANFFERRMPPP